MSGQNHGRAKRREKIGNNGSNGGYGIPQAEEEGVQSPEAIYHVMNHGAHPELFLKKANMRK